jgi:hypothetical protein
MLALVAATGALAPMACSEPLPDYGPPEPGGFTVMLPLDPDAEAMEPEGGVAPLVCDGGTPDCGVSWSGTLYPKLTGMWGCSNGGCHGDGTFKPTIAVGDASATYAALAGYTGTAITGSPYFGEPFVLPCSTDPTKSAFLCSVSAPTCGTALMPLAGTGATPLGAADLASIATWIACGAPNN